VNVALWVLQGLLAAHTAMGAVWKLSNSEQAVPSLRALPHGVWLALAGVELLCVIGLLVPVVARSQMAIAVTAAAVIGAEMVLFGVVHLRASVGGHGQLVYWMVVLALCAALVAGRLSSGR
jgi:hypothetical protein